MTQGQAWPVSVSFLETTGTVSGFLPHVPGVEPI